MSTKLREIIIERMDELANEGDYEQAEILRGILRKADDKKAEGFKPRRAPDMNGDVLDYRYYNTGNIGVAIVAVKGYINDWAAYVSALPNFAGTGQVVNKAASNGIKMSESEGKALFPEVAKHFKWRP